MDNLKYAKATGCLQIATSVAAAYVESIARMGNMDAWSREELFTVARKLRAADKEAESMCSPGQENRGEQVTE
jgi:hypothetical protein